MQIGKLNRTIHHDWSKSNTIRHRCQKEIQCNSILAPFTKLQTLRRYLGSVHNLVSNTDVTVAIVTVILCRKFCRLSTRSAYAKSFTLAPERMEWNRSTSSYSPTWKVVMQNIPSNRNVGVHRMLKNQIVDVLRFHKVSQHVRVNAAFVFSVKQNGQISLTRAHTTHSPLHYH